MGDAEEDLIIEGAVMTARIQAAHRLGRKPNREELNAAIDDEVNASVRRRQISPDRRDAISEAAQNFAASNFKTYHDYQIYLKGKSIFLAMAARKRAIDARAEANAKAYKEKNEREWEDARDEAGKNAGGRRRSGKRGAKTVRRRRSRRLRPTRRRRPF